MTDVSPKPSVASRIKVDRPQYARIGDLLRGRILSGLYPVDGLLPTEGELCSEFSISRHTVREALRRLSEAGLIERKQGSGSRVLAAEPHQNYVHAMRSLDQLFQYASDTRFSIVSVTSGQPDVGLFPDLSDVSGQDWLIVNGFRLERDEDILICHSTVLVNGHFANISEMFQSYTGAIYRLIEEKFGVEVSEVMQDITVAQMPLDAAAVLGEKPDAMAVRVARRYLDANGTTLLASVNYHPADRFSYSMKLKREERRSAFV
jgi:GntR family transcriptional regulator